MDKQQALAKMISPGMRRPGKPHGGVIQVLVTRACDKACFHCTQGSQLAGKPSMMTPEQFDLALRSLDGYFGTVGMFGGNPAMHPKFDELCAIMRERVPYEQRGIWCNNPLGQGKIIRETFNPARSNLNVHLDVDAFNEFKRDWPESLPFGAHADSRHAPPFVAMRDVLKKQCNACGGRCRRSAHDGCTESGADVMDEWDCSDCEGSGEVYDENKAWELISGCDVNQHWSALIGTFRGELRAWFCEIAGAQAMLHEGEESYPDTGIPIDESSVATNVPWWRLEMKDFAPQVEKHCHECGVPLRGYGELACAGEEGVEQVSATHEAIYKPKRKGRKLELVVRAKQLNSKSLKVTDYLGGARK